MQEIWPDLRTVCFSGIIKYVDVPEEDEEGNVTYEEFLASGNIQSYAW